MARKKKIQKQTFTIKIEEECFNVAKMTPEEIRVPAAMEIEENDEQEKKGILQMLMPTLRTPIRVKPKASPNPRRIRHRSLGGKLGIKELGIKKGNLKV